MNRDDYLTLKAAYRVIEAAGHDAIAELAIAEAAQKATGQLREHAAFITALGNGLAQFTAWSQSQPLQQNATPATTH